MAHRNIIVVGASAGGVEALSDLAHALPVLNAAVFITLHVPRNGTSVLPSILTRAGVMPASHPDDGQKFEPGHVYVAPPDFHLLFGAGYTIRLVRGPTDNGNRPAIDPMFRSAALRYGVRVIGVVLTGNLDDGTAGLISIRRHGGVGVVQDPGEATFPGMVESAIAHGAADHVVRVGEMSAVLQRLLAEPLADGSRAGEAVD